MRPKWAETLRHSGVKSLAFEALRPQAGQRGAIASDAASARRDPHHPPTSQIATLPRSSTSGKGTDQWQQLRS